MDGRVAASIHIVDLDADEVRQWKEWLRPLKTSVRSYLSIDQLLAEQEQPASGCLLVGLPDAARSSRNVLIELRARNAPLAIVVIGTSIPIPEAVRAIKAGVYSVLERPVQREEFITTVSQALRQSCADWDAVFSWTSLLQLLSEREREVVNLLLDGRTTKQIGKMLNISTSTVHKHRTRVFSKLRVDSSTDLVLKSAHFRSRSAPSV